MDKTRNRTRTTLRACILFCLLALFTISFTCAAHARRLPKPKITNVYVHGTVRTSKLKSDGAADKTLQIDGAYLNLIVDADLKVKRLIPASGYADTALTIMGSGNHTLTIDSTGSDVWDNANPPAALRAGSLQVKGCRLNVSAIWYAIEAAQDVMIYTSDIKAASANVEICSRNGNMKIQDSTIDCSNTGGSNGIAAVFGNLDIIDSDINAYGSSAAVRGDAVRLENSRITARSNTQSAISANNSLEITGCTVTAENPGSGEFDNWYAVGSTSGSVTIKDSEVSASGNPSGIYGGTKILIEGGTVKASGSKSAISAKNSVELGSGTTVLSPAGAKPGKTDWNTNVPYGIAASGGKTVLSAVIGPSPEVISGKISEGKPVNVDTVNEIAVEMNEAKIEQGSSFFPIQLKGTPASKTVVKLSWNSAPGAMEYIVFGAPCDGGHAYQPFANVTGTSWRQGNLQPGTYYKYMVAAIRGGSVVGLSKPVYVGTKGGKAGNPKKVTVNKKKLKLKKGATKKIKAKMKKKGRVRIFRPIGYESSDKSVATVNSSGMVKAVGKGTCQIYAYAQNGMFAKVKVTVTVK